MIKVLIADDQELVRQSLQIVPNSRPDTVVTDVASNGQGAIRSVRKDKPDVILMDIRIPKLGGVQCMKTIKENYPQTKVTVLTIFDDGEYVYNVLEYGASGYLLKGVPTDEPANTITTMYNGQAMTNPDIATKVLRLSSQMVQADYTILAGDKNVDELTKAERKITAQVEKGVNNREIAEAPKLSEGTVRNYPDTIPSKLGLRGRIQLVIWAVQADVRKRLGT